VRTEPPEGNILVRHLKDYYQMLLLVQIDLSNADVPLFEVYEKKILGLLGAHGARLEARLRSKDGLTEFHLLEFPDAAALEGFRADPARLGAQDMWKRCGASSAITEVGRID
jgi:hypothetical protein